MSKNTAWGAVDSTDDEAAAAAERARDLFA
jgi:hypothetical protein